MVKVMAKWTQRRRQGNSMWLSCLSIWTMRHTVYLSPSGDVTQGKEGCYKVFLTVVVALGWAAALHTRCLNLKVNLSQKSQQPVSAPKLWGKKLCLLKRTLLRFTHASAPLQTPAPCSTVGVKHSQSQMLTNSFMHLLLMVGFSWLYTDM